MAQHAIHISDIRAFKGCRRKWSWSSPLRANLEPNIPYVPFFLGRAVHYCLEQYYKRWMTDQEILVPMAYLDEWASNELAIMEASTGTLWNGEVQQFDEQVALANSMLKHYMVWQKKDTTNWRDENLEWLTLPNGEKALEVEFNVPLLGKSGRKSNRVFLQGRFDGLVRNVVDDTLWIWETKTTRSIKELSRSLANDEQAGAYIYAAQQLFGQKVEGVLYNMLRKKAPTEPEILKNGMVSKNKKVDTSAEMYIEAIKKQHPGCSERYLLQEYGEVIDHLAANEDQKFFARIPVRRTRYEIEQLASDLHTVALEMVRDTTPIYPAPSWLNCNFCSFKNPCLAYNSGGDYKFLLENEFRHREVATSWRSLSSGEREE